MGNHSSVHVMQAEDVASHVVLPNEALQFRESMLEFIQLHEAAEERAFIVNM
jgi:hypothetical protein